MTRVRRPIDSSDFTAIPRTRQIIETLPDMLRICPKHGEEVTIREGKLLSKQGGGVPFADANWEGCCDAAIDRVMEILGLIDRAKQTYRDELANKLEPSTSVRWLPSSWTRVTTLSDLMRSTLPIKLARQATKGRSTSYALALLTLTV